MRFIFAASYYSILLIAFTGLSLCSAATCFEPGACNGTYDESASTIIKQLTQRFGQPPPSFDSTLPRDGNVVTVCETFTEAVTTSSSSYPKGMESYPLGCGRKMTYLIAQYVKQGTPNSRISGVETTTITTSTQFTTGAQITVGGTIGTVQESVQETNGTSWATTVSFNVLLWSQVYMPQRDVRVDGTPGERCGTSRMAFSRCPEK